MADDSEALVQRATEEGESVLASEQISRPRPSRPPPPDVRRQAPSGVSPESRESEGVSLPGEQSSVQPPAMSSQSSAAGYTPSAPPPAYTPYAEQSAPYTPPSTHPPTVIPVTVTPIDPVLVRWFYKEPSFYWKPFSGCDSYLLETRYQELVTRGDKGDLNRWIVRVRGEMYEANLQDKTCDAIFWKGPSEPLLRATWFEITSEKRWYPLKDEEVIIVEKAHCETTWRQRANTALTGVDAHPNKVEWKRITMENHDVVWYGNDEIWKIKRDFSNKMKIKMGFSVGNKLVRGFKEPALPSDGDYPPISHFVFVLHGIGQNMGANPSSTELKHIVKTTNELRATCTEVTKKHFTKDWSKGRVEFIPIDWRSSLILDNGLIQDITPLSISKIREITNDTVLDIFYYLSPAFNQEMKDSVRFFLNKYFLKIMDEFPDFVSRGGKFSIFAHSLGSVITYDILSEYKDTLDTTLRSQSEPSACDGEGESLESQLLKARTRVAELENALRAQGSTMAGKKKMTGVKFPVEHFFAVGSPLGVFLAMRDLSKHVDAGHQSAKGLLPHSVCKRIHNIMHPSDPVVYRLEPLLCHHYKQIKPMKLDSTSSGVSKGMLNVAAGTSGEPEQEQKKSFFTNFFGGSKQSVQAKDLPTNKMMDDDSCLTAKDRLQERLDFQLREGIVENQYLSSLFAHTSYWGNADVLLFILCQIYQYQA